MSIPYCGTSDEFNEMLSKVDLESESFISFYDYVLESFEKFDKDKSFDKFKNYIYKYDEFYINAKEHYRLVEEELTNKEIYNRLKETKMIEGKDYMVSIRQSEPKKESTCRLTRLLKNTDLPYDGLEEVYLIAPKSLHKLIVKAPNHCIGIRNRFIIYTHCMNKYLIFYEEYKMKRMKHICAKKDKHIEELKKQNEILSNTFSNKVDSVVETIVELKKDINQGKVLVLVLISFVYNILSFDSINLKNKICYVIIILQFLFNSL